MTGSTPTPEAPALPGAPVALCPSAALVERGRAFVFDVTVWRQPARAFVLRFEGRPVGYLNRCVHVPVEMDWQPGEFLDMDRRWIVCSIHGATYEPTDGRCVAGPCGRGRLTALQLAESDGQVYWYPSADIRPGAPAASLVPLTSAPLPEPTEPPGASDAPPNDHP